MGVSIYSHTNEFVHRLGAQRELVYAVLQATCLPLKNLGSIKKIGEANGHRDLTTISTIRAATERQIKSFFNSANDEDAEKYFAFTAKIPLAITCYRDIQLLFSCKSYADTYIDRELVILAPKYRLRKLAYLLLRDQSSSQRFVIPGIHAFGRVFRTLARTILHRRPKVSLNSTVVLFTLIRPNANNSKVINNIMSA